LLNELDLKVTVTDPAKCVSIVADRAGLNDKKTTAQALKILKDRGVVPSLAGKDTMGLAATALYIACVRNGGKAKKTQKELAEAAGVTEITIRHRSNEIKSVIEEKGVLSTLRQLGSEIVRVNFRQLGILAEDAGTSVFEIVRSIIIPIRLYGK